MAVIAERACQSELGQGQMEVDLEKAPNSNLLHSEWEPIDRMESSRNQPLGESSIGAAVVMCNIEPFAASTNRGTGLKKIQWSRKREPPIGGEWATYCEVGCW
ncbi:hypothetical protein N7468_007688 [Penicillium chermesinum]|uniref:Uncharacterized protein n=1 Tax=Penicillium chermesinum TaxID=63820 RepID=A0A9W9NWX4_9EURO|nr:uncharacterized protein N7468_007688 [Penicillium chermesinum]KAJ5226463.1 hypothetical protein N7468_007688 [Penicillium chermesinum]